MKHIFYILSIMLIANSAVITGSQSKLSISGGSMNVNSGGSTVTVGSGEITFIEEGLAPTKPRKLKADDLKDIINELSMTDDEKLINLKFAPLKYMVSKKIRRFLIKAGIPSRNILFKKKGLKVYLFIKQIDISLIKEIYPAFYKAANSYYKKNKKRLKQKSKIPTILVKLKIIKKYHRSIYYKYN